MCKTHKSCNFHTSPSVKGKNLIALKAGSTVHALDILLRSSLKKKVNWYGKARNFRGPTNSLKQQTQCNDINGCSAGGVYLRPYTIFK